MEGKRAVFLGRVEHHALIEVLTGRDELSQKTYGDPKGPVPQQEVYRITLLLGQGKELFRHLMAFRNSARL
jgi:hypothetical protein